MLGGSKVQDLTFEKEEGISKPVYPTAKLTNFNWQLLDAAMFMEFSFLNQNDTSQCHTPVASPHPEKSAGETLERAGEKCLTGAKKCDEERGKVLQLKEGAEFPKDSLWSDTADDITLAKGKHDSPLYGEARESKARKKVLALTKLRRGGDLTAKTLRQLNATSRTDKTESRNHCEADASDLTETYKYNLPITIPKGLQFDKEFNKNITKEVLNYNDLYRGIGKLGCGDDERLIFELWELLEGNEHNGVSKRKLNTALKIILKVETPKAETLLSLGSGLTLSELRQKFHQFYFNRIHSKSKHNYLAEKKTYELPVNKNISSLITLNNIIKSTKKQVKGNVKTIKLHQRLCMSKINKSVLERELPAKKSIKSLNASVSAKAVDSVQQGKCMKKYSVVESTKNDLLGTRGRVAMTSAVKRPADKLCDTPNKLPKSNSYLSLRSVKLRSSSKR